jgi:hypothetical protein
LFIGIVVIALGLGLTWLFFGHLLFPGSPTKFAAGPTVNAIIGNGVLPENVTLTGIVNITGQGIYPTAVVFRHTNPNLTYNALLAGNNYSITLPNSNTYTVAVIWAGPYLWQRGFTPVLPREWVIRLEANQTPFVDNITVPLPNAQITLNGHVTLVAPNVSQTGTVLRSPTKITFTATNGKTFTANITSSTSNTLVYLQNLNTTGYYNHTEDNYSLSLPDWMNYSVSITYNELYGKFGSCSVGSLDVDAGVGVTNIVESYKC